MLSPVTIERLAPAAPEGNASGTPVRNDGFKVLGIQWLRAIAALMVINAHVEFAIPNEHLPMFLRGGPYFGMGVDIFFVISGFVIFCSIEKASNPGNFLSRRMVRILPVYYVMTLAALIMGYPSSLNALWNSFLFLPLLDKDEFTSPVVGIGWTLCYEFYFYLLVAMFVLTRQRSRLVAVGGLLASVALLWLSGHHVAIEFLFSPLLLEFGFGILLFKLWRRGALKNCYSGVLLIGAGAVLTLLFRSPGATLPEVDIAHNLARIWRVGFPAALLVAGVVACEEWIRKLPDWLSNLGAASYSLYLVHLFVIGYVGRFYQWKWISPWQGWFLIFLLSIIAAFISRNLLEIRLSNWIRRRFEGSSAESFKSR